MVPNIIFGAYKHTLDSKGPAMKTRNISSLDKVTEIYRRYPHYNLGLEAHALNIYMDNERKSTEEEKILEPLTERRAQTVKDALIDKGLSENMIATHAYGGKFPIVSIYDRSVRWKNRRVEFIMIEPDETEQESAD